jgi:hypothetical protein
MTDIKSIESITKTLGGWRLYWDAELDFLGLNISHSLVVPFALAIVTVSKQQ